MDSRLRIEQTAADWLARRDSGRWTDEDQVDLDAWLADSSAHMVEFLRLEAAWEAANRYRAMGAGVPSGRVPTLEEWRASPFFKHAPRRSTVPTAKPKRSLTPYAVAATVLLGIAIAVFLYSGRDTYSTAIGVTTAVPLPDGSKVTLNTSSEITLAVTDAERRVNLKQGEAYFEVAKDERRPFVVIAGRQRIVALGTAFSVRKFAGDEVRVVVTEGKVAVDDLKQRTERKVLSAGAIADTDASSVNVRQQPVPEVDEYLSWRSGFIVFHRTPLAQAVAEFNRYNIRQVVIRDPALATVPVSGNFRATNVDAFSRLLQEGMGIRVHAEGNRLLLSGP